MNDSLRSPQLQSNGRYPASQLSPPASIPTDLRPYSRERHGVTTYRMAWCAEIALVGMALLLAVFNVMSVWHTGNRVEGILLAAGWVAIAVVELSVIPLAGAARICGWKDKWLAIIGVLGVAGLSAWNVYEFNEFASYYLTQPARDAVIDLAAKRRTVENLRKHADKLTLTQQAATSEGSRLSQEHAARLASTSAAYKEQMDTRRAEYEARVATLEASLPKAAQPDRSVTAALQLLLEKRQGLASARDMKLRELQRQGEAAKAARSAEAATLRAAREAQRSAYQVEIDKLRQAMFTEMAGASGVFKEARKQQIRERYDREIKEVNAKVAQIDQESIPSTALTAPSLAPESAAIRRQADEEIAAVERQMADLREIQKKSAQADEAGRAQGIARVRAQILPLQEDYQRAVDHERKAHDASMAESKRVFDARIQGLAQASLLEGELQQRLAAMRSEANQLEEEANNLEARTDSRMERILYFRIAKWFHEGPGLPTKDDYLRGQIWLFAPAGAFLSLVAISLAYLGTGLQVAEDSVKKNDGQADKNDQALRAAEQRNQTLQEELAKLSDKVEALKVKIVAAKIETANAVHSIPQIITVAGGK